MAEVATLVLRLFAPPPKLTISQWADDRRYLSPEASAEPGKWSTGRAEYQRAIMDAISDPAIPKVVCIKGSQVGWTEIINNACGYYIDQDPSTMLVIQPTLDLAEVWSKDRLAPMLRDTPVLHGRVHAVKSRDSGNTILQKAYPGGRLAIIGANAPAALASRPIRVVLADEVDRYPVSAGTEGDPLALAAKRQATYWNKKTLVGSTPTRVSTSVINREWLLSDQRRYFVPCHACDHPQHLQWSNVRWDKGPNGEHMAVTAHYVCESCGAVWDDIDRWDATKRGVWKATAKSDGGVVGFHIPGMLSPWLTLQDIVREFLQARHDPQLLQVWTNTILGEPWEEAGETVDGNALMNRLESYLPNALPAGVRFITAGVDVQGDRLEVQVIGWGWNEESWGILYEVLHGDPAQRMVWDDLDALLLATYQTEDGRALRVRSGCIDTGGHHGNQVHTFCRTRRNRRIFPTKGVAGPRPIWPKQASKTKDKKNEVFIIGVDTAKDATYGRLRNVKPGTPGYIHFCAPYADVDDDAPRHDFNPVYFEQLTSERVETRKKEGRPYRVWVLPDKKRNEALDTFVLAMAARMALPIRLKRPLNEVQQDDQPVVEGRKESAHEPATALTSPPPMIEARKDTPARNGPKRVRRVFRSSFMGGGQTS
jgi:phage terminase large subunit GpA-like protein